MCSVAVSEDHELATTLPSHTQELVLSAMEYISTLTTHVDGQVSHAAMSALETILSEVGIDSALFPSISAFVASRVVPQFTVSAAV